MSIRIDQPFPYGIIDRAMDAELDRHLGEKTIDDLKDEIEELKNENSILSRESDEWQGMALLYEREKEELQERLAAIAREIAANNEQLVSLLRDPDYQ